MKGTEERKQMQGGAEGSSGKQDIGRKAPKNHQSNAKLWQRMSFTQKLK
jgi:hypothetical protein